MAHVFAISLLAAASARAASKDGAQYCGTHRWQPFIAEAAEKFQLPPAWLHAVMRVESAGCTHIDGKPTTSSAGAMGLMQLIPATWTAYRRRLTLGDDPHDPRDNILAGAAFLHDLHELYGYPGLFAAYHAGPGRYEQHKSGGRALPPSTLEYLTRVQRTAAAGDDASIEESNAAEPPSRGIFVALKHVPESKTQPVRSPPERGLFVRLSAQDRTASESPDVQGE